MVKKVLGSPLALIAGIGMFAIGGLHFFRLAVAPRLPGGK